MAAIGAHSSAAAMITGIRGSTLHTSAATYSDQEDANRRSPTLGAAAPDAAEPSRRGCRTGLECRASPGPQLYVTINLTGVAGLTVDIARAELASMPSSVIAVSSDTGARITLAALPPEVTRKLDGEPTGSTVAAPVGRHQITLKKK